MAPIGTRTPTKATFDATYRDVDLGEFGDSMALRGIRFNGRATGRNRMEWPLGHFSAGVRGAGQVTVQPPAGELLLGRMAPSELTTEEDRLGKVWGPFAARLPVARVPIGAEFCTSSTPTGSTSARAASRLARRTSSSRAARRGAANRTFRFMSPALTGSRAIGSWRASSRRSAPIPGPWTSADGASSTA